MRFAPFPVAVRQVVDERVRLFGDIGIALQVEGGLEPGVRIEAQLGPLAQVVQHGIHGLDVLIATLLTVVFGVEDPREANRARVAQQAHAPTRALEGPALHQALAKAANPIRHT